EWMGVQRHLKVAGIFARLHYRDGKSKYLAEIPRFLDYIRKTCNRYEELRPLGALVRDLAGIEEQVGYTF
ncbi:MAG: aminoglycoside phosphotransferase, partial [Aquaspirillum sp.]